jgi:aquaporin rerated protein, other eukaryote
MQAHLVAAVGEFVGTFLFLYFSYAGNVMAASQASTAGPNGGMSSETVVFTSLAYSLSLLVNV